MVAPTIINIAQLTANPQFTVLLTCHCEERSDAAISLYGYRFNEIATPSARDDNVRDKPQFTVQILDLARSLCEVRNVYPIK